jgi:hypothetical protein
MPPKKVTTYMNSDDNDIQKKKRGRPPISKETTKHKTFIEEDKADKEDEELVLHLPSFDDEVTDKKNVFTMIESEQSENNNVTKKIEIKTLTEDENSSEYGTDVSKLIGEINKRETIIKALKENLKNYKNLNQDNLLTVTKENKKQLINLGLISLNGNKLCIAEKSKYACWWCTYNFDSFPIFLPEKYQNNNYYVFGNFCSFSCSFAYNDGLDDYRRNIRNALIKKLYTDIFHMDCNIKPAGPREVLEKFGGPMSIDKYRDIKQICTKNVKINIPPMIPLLSYFEEATLEH